MVKSEGTFIRCYFSRHISKRLLNSKSATRHVDRQTHKNFSVADMHSEKLTCKGCMVV